MKNLKWTLVSGLLLLSLVLAACAPQQPIQVTVVVKETQVVKQVETQVVQQTVEVKAKSFSIPHPILGDLKVRQAIAYCTNPLELIQSVYPFVSPENQMKQVMTGPFPQDSWAYYGGPEVVRYFDPANPKAGPEKGMKLLDEAGWTGDAGQIRSNKNGDRMSLKFTTTNASFRKTWSAVWIQQMAACGVEVLPLYAPGSWWFGSTTGLRHRDFELGAYAWVGEADPKGQTIYACNQIPLPENGWQGQNSGGWCNKVASDAINAANNSLDRQERIAQYKTFQIEFSKDMVSLPVFQRAEGSAATSRLKNFKPNPTESYYQWNAHEWELTDGKDSLVLAMTQEPDTMYTLVTQAAVQRNIGWLVYEQGASQVNYDFQPAQWLKLPTVESGLTKLNDVDVKEGDPVVDATGTPVDADGKVLTLQKGMKIKTADGQEVEYTGGTVKMKQMVVTYQWQPNLKWSDGQPVVKADFELGYKNDCDPASGSADYSVCQSIQKVDFTSDSEQVVAYKPGYQSYLSTVYVSPFSYYPSHQVIQSEGKYKGKTLAEIPTADWASLPEIAELPLGTGPYMLKSWEKGVKMELEANPYYWRGVDTLKIKKITVLIVADTNQAVAQLLTGDVDVIGSETLGAGAEVQTVLDAVKAGKPIQALIEPSATWEHIDMQLFLP